MWEFGHLHGTWQQDTDRLHTSVQTKKKKEKGFSDWRMARAVDNVVTRRWEAHRPPALKCDYLVKFSGAEGMGGSVVL